MLAIIIIIGAALLIAAYFGLCAFFQELEELERRSQDIADLSEAEDGKKGRSHE